MEMKPRAENAMGIIWHNLAEGGRGGGGASRHCCQNNRNGPLIDNQLARLICIARGSLTSQ